MRYLKLSENQNKGNDIAVNEYGERIAPKPENRKTQQETMLRQITDPTADIRSLSAAPLFLPREFPPQLSAGSRLKMQAIITIM